MQKRVGRGTVGAIGKRAGTWRRPSATGRGQRLRDDTVGMPADGRRRADAAAGDESDDEQGHAGTRQAACSLCGAQVADGLHAAAFECTAMPTVGGRAAGTCKAELLQRLQAARTVVPEVGRIPEAMTMAALVKAAKATDLWQQPAAERPAEERTADTGEVVFRARTAHARHCRAGEVAVFPADEAGPETGLMRWVAMAIVRAASASGAGGVVQAWRPPSAQWKGAR